MRARASDPSIVRAPHNEALNRTWNSAAHHGCTVCAMGEAPLTAPVSEDRTAVWFLWLRSSDPGRRQPSEVCSTRD